MHTIGIQLLQEQYLQTLGAQLCRGFGLGWSQDHIALRGIPFLIIALLFPRIEVSAIIKDDCVVVTESVSISGKKGEQEVNVIHNVDGKNLERDISRSDRGLEELRAEWGSPFLHGAYLVGKKFLDLGTGDGRMVNELVADLKARGVNKPDVIGVDLVLNEAQRTGVNKEHFVKADAVKLPFKDSEFDIVHSFESVFSYYSQAGPPESAAVWSRALKEVHRVTKPGGIVHLQVLEFRTKSKLAEIEKTGMFRVLRPKGEWGSEDGKIVLQVIKK